jgi:hypothetical protein
VAASHAGVIGVAAQSLSRTADRRVGGRVGRGVGRDIGGRIFRCVVRRVLRGVGRRCVGRRVVVAANDRGALGARGEPRGERERAQPSEGRWRGRQRGARLRAGR